MNKGPVIGLTALSGFALRTVTRLSAVSRVADPAFPWVIALSHVGFLAVQFHLLERHKVPAVRSWGPACVCSRMPLPREVTFVRLPF